MDNVDIRKYIIQNFKNTDINGIRESIESSVQEKDEVTLPGLGVFFEILWQNCDEELRNKTLEILKNNF